MSITPTICPNDRCPAIVDGVLLRFDGVHFTDEARQILAPALESQILATGAMGGPVRGPSQGSTR
jgi:lysophospholipase L1-like esterase